MLAQLVDDLVHLEGGQDGLDQHGAADGAAGHADVVLGQVEHVVPQAGLEVRLHLGQVEVGAEAALDRLEGVVEEVQAKVEQRGAHGLAVDRDVLLLQVPAARPHNQGRQRPVRPQLVLLLPLLEVDLAPDRVVEVDLAVDHVVPCRSARVCTHTHTPSAEALTLGIPSSLFDVDHRPRPLNSHTRSLTHSHHTPLAGRQAGRQAGALTHLPDQPCKSRRRRSAR